VNRAAMPEGGGPLISTRIWDDLFVYETITD